MLSRATLVAVLLLLPGGAFAGTPCTDETPPARYRHEPAKPYTVSYLSASVMTRLCGYRANGEPEVYGCVDTDTRPAAIFIGKDLPKNWQVCLVTHEKAHLNGWPADHPQ